MQFIDGHLYLVYTPAYDPDANRIEWLWRISRRVITAARSSFCSRMWRSIFRHWLEIP